MDDDIVRPEAMQPTPRIQRLYHRLVHRWGEADDILVFDGQRAVRPGILDAVHVAVWDPDDTCDVTSFFTLGMSEATMVGADYRTELHLGRRGPLSPDERKQLPVFLANLSEYPFMHRLKLGWWESVVNPGAIPGFPHCTQLLLAPDLGADEASRLDHFPTPDEDVRVLRVIPITPHEHHILKDHGGRDAFLDYWETSGVDLWSSRQDRDGA